MKTYYGRCECGTSEISISLPQNLDCYAPRACNCDFCTIRNIEYLSDNKGIITIKSVKPLNQIKQGSNQATFLGCATCSTIIGVAYMNDDVCVGAVNATRLTDKSLLMAPVSISPKNLTSEEKIERWLTLWSPLNIT